MATHADGSAHFMQIYIDTKDNILCSVPYFLDSQTNRKLVYKDFLPIHWPSPISDLQVRRSVRY